MSRLPAPLPRLLAALARMVRALEHRRAAKALLHLDARGLADIGLSHGAVAAVFEATTPFEDPTPHLSRIAARRGLVPDGRENPASDKDAGPEKARSGSLPSSAPLAFA